MPSAFLADRGVVRVTGDDARSFLDGLLTSNMHSVAVDRARFAALLTPQGKILVDFIVAEADGEIGGGFYLDVPRALAPDLAKRLAMYRLRAKVVVENVSDTLGITVYWGGAEAPEEDGLAYADPRVPGLGDRLIAERELARSLADSTDAAWDAHRIALGVPEGGRDFTYGDAFPHETDMDQLGGVDFDKGCYVGQEVVSRMEHRGTARTRIVPVVYPEGIAAMEGADVMAGDRRIGTAGSAGPGGTGLAMLRLDRLEEALAAGEPVRAGGLLVMPRHPGWARFAVPGVSR
jgi:folate-binding protein YgfZ